MNKKLLREIGKTIDPMDKSLDHFLRPLEVKMLDKLVPLVPSWLETQHLTLATIPLSFLIVLAGGLARGNKIWFLAHILIIAAQYLSDALDGEIGRRRKTGLIRWGFYADHFLDFIFSQSLILSYILAFPSNWFGLFLIGICLGAMFVHEALSCVLTGHYNVGGYGGFGGTEMWVVVGLIDLWLIEKRPARIDSIVLGLLVCSLLVLTAQFLKNSRIFWRKDMKAKNSKTGQKSFH